MAWPVSDCFIQVLVIDLYIPEILGGVATAAVGAELAMVDVILPVTDVTLARQFQVRGRWFVVALVAAQVFVTVFECKAGMFSVVEIPDSPAVRVVALVAGIPEHCLVFIVITMATDTILWRVLECSRGVALFAGGCSMQTK